MTTGRPSIFTQELANAICERMADGESLRSICRSEDMPNVATVIRWLADPEHINFCAQYAVAREARADLLFDEITDIADDATNDWMARNGKDDEGYALNGEHVQRSRLRVDARKWVAARMAPKKYGEKITTEITGKDGGALEVATRVVIVPPKSPAQTSVEPLKREGDA